MLPLLWIALAFTAGILIAHYIAGSIWIWAAFCILFLCLIIFSRKYSGQLPLLSRIRKDLRVSLPVLLLVLALGGERTALGQTSFTQKDLAWYNDRGSYTLTAVIDQSPDRRVNATYLHLAARELYDPTTMTYHRIQGAALLRVDAGAPWQLGDLLQFTAAPKTPFEAADFSYRAYLERQGIFTVIYYSTSVKRIGTGQASKFRIALDWLQQKASQSIFAIFPQPESGLLAGILLGNDNDLPQAAKEAYQNTGTAHIIAISGFNMAVLAALFLALFTRVLNRYWAAALSALALITYAAFVGASPSVVRAAIMAIVAFFGHLIGRKGGSMNALGLSAAVMLAINPLLLWDASFQLSFAATSGLVLFASPMQAWLEGFLSKHFSEKAAVRVSGPVSEYFLFSLAAQAATLPVIAIQFKQISLTSLLANPLVLPVQTVILVGGGMATIAGMMLPFLGKLLAFLVWPFLAFSNRVVEWLNQIPNGAITVTGTLAIWIGIAGILIIMLALIRVYLKKFYKKIKFVYLAGFLLTAAVLVWTLALRQPNGLLHLSLLRAEDGTALLLQSPNGETLLIDPGGDPNTLSSSLSRSISPWNFHLDAALLTQRDSVAVLTNLNDRLPVKLTILTPSVYEASDAQAALSFPSGMQNKKLSEGESIQLDKEVLIQPVASASGNTALLITYAQTRILIPAGVDPALLQPNSIEGLSVLILNDADAANLPADMWQNFGARVILWNSANLAPDPGWISADNHPLITLDSDGTTYSLHSSVE